MTFNLLGLFWIINLRNGFGFDVESVSFLPIILVDEDDEPIVSTLNGLHISVPFLALSVGVLSTLEESNDE